jgi:pectate lyase
VLLTTGVSLIDIQKKNGLTIFSANGSTIRHAHLNIKNGSNIIVRNLRFDELWEWDELSKGQYDKKNWDFMTIGDSGSITGLWIDHCTFTKSYDGIVDIKNGSAGITISWCKYTGDDGATNPNSFVWQQINALEANRSSYAMYNALRTAGFSTTDIVTVIQGHDKTHLIGALDLDSNNALHTVTLHHEWFINPWDRLPRLRAGNVHDYNIYVDDTLGLAAKRLRDQHSFSSSYSFNPFLNGTISTENGATLVEKSVYIDCVTPLRNNQTNPSDPEYTGKIEAIDCIYHFDNSDGSTTDYRGDSTNATGFALFGPAQASVIAFSWNLTNNQLPYTYYPDDPSQLKAIVTSLTAGAGAGVLTWNKTNWLVTSYAPTGPVIVADPQSQTASMGGTNTFTVVAGGSAPLMYQWYFNTNSLIAGATNSSLTILNVSGTNVGTYFVVVSNSVSAATSGSATLTIPVAADPFSTWQSNYFGCVSCPQAAPNADPLGKGISNTNQFVLGLNPTNPASVFRILSVVPQSNDVVITWATGAGPSNVVQATIGDGSGGYATNFLDISGALAIPGSGNATNSFRDTGGATNNPSRYYRIRLGP